MQFCIKVPNQKFNMMIIIVGFYCWILLFILFRSYREGYVLSFYTKFLLKYFIKFLKWNLLFLLWEITFSQSVVRKLCIIKKRKSWVLGQRINKSIFKFESDIWYYILILQLANTIMIFSFIITVPNYHLTLNFHTLQTIQISLIFF